ncbi:uncharacterized protein LOC124309404 [Neodiprion virginianus]|uniref:uncharacterized protein LOC124309404 n=1 Tax=Neodiprion virginianus TaxID=2961670 RepID=UPI001EE6B02A|nr:uncharacterized protein LOC124309404 [Neodiprion virginianus]
MDDCEEIEHSVELSERNWNRVINRAIKAGYREGVEEGKKSVFQEGFDIGYNDAFETAFVLGKYKGLATAMSNDSQTPPATDDVLEKTRRGACYVCNESTKSKVKTDDFVKMPLQDIRNGQKKYSTRILETLQHQFDKLTSKHVTCINNAVL